MWEAWTLAQSGPDWGREGAAPPLAPTPGKDRAGWGISETGRAPRGPRANPGTGQHGPSVEGGHAARGEGPGGGREEMGGFLARAKESTLRAAPATGLKQASPWAAGAGSCPPRRGPCCTPPLSPAESCSKNSLYTARKQLESHGPFQPLESSSFLTVWGVSRVQEAGEGPGWDTGGRSRAGESGGGMAASAQCPGSSDSGAAGQALLFQKVQPALAFPWSRRGGEGGERERERELHSEPTAGLSCSPGQAGQSPEWDWATLHQWHSNF